MKPSPALTAPKIIEAQKWQRLLKLAKNNLNIGSPTEPEIRAAMGKAIREVKRNAKLKNIKLVVANKKAWMVPK